jgi:hypothetical protein
MPNRNRTLRLGTLLALAGLCVVVLAGCGGGSGNAVGLLKQTFCGKHDVRSGKLDVALTVNPKGLHNLKGPISLSLSGPFQSRGSGQLPESDLTISIGAMGNAVAAEVISTGTHGYVSLQGSSYQLPQASFQSLESSFSRFAHPPGCSSKSASRLNLHPLHWLTDPQVAGTETVGGASTTHIHAGVDVAALLGDLGSLLSKAPSLGLGGSSGSLSPSTISAIASAIQAPSFDAWTGVSDKTLRRLRIHLLLQIPSQFSTILGGLQSADIGLSMQYANLNQPQTVTAPTNLQPYGQLQTKVAQLFSTFRTQLSGVLSGALGSGSISSGATGGLGGTSGYQAYARCIQAAGGDVTKMQKCAPLLGGK